MKVTRNVLSIVLVAVTGVAAQAEPLPDGQREAWAVGTAPGDARESATWAYNTLDCDTCMWGLNLSWADPTCYTDFSNCGGLYMLALSTEQVDLGPLIFEVVEYDDGAGNSWFLDVFFDDYVADATIWGDTGLLQPLVAFAEPMLMDNTHDGAVEKAYRHHAVWLSADGTTLYGSWQWEVLSLVGDKFAYTLIAGELDAPLDPADTFEIPAEGIFCFDVEDENDAPALSFLLGGNLDDPDFPHPADLYETGYNDPTFWMLAGFDDPQVDPNYDGEPGLSYLDLINTGTLVNWAFVGADGELAHGHPTRMGIPGGDPCDGDLDGDGDIDQSDLGVLLAAYGVSSDGDLDWDGDTDQADLGILLANYGCGV
jgi:hypothetical protein